MINISTCKFRFLIRSFCREVYAHMFLLHFCYHIEHHVKLLALVFY